MDISNMIGGGSGPKSAEAHDDEIDLKPLDLDDPEAEIVPETDDSDLDVGVEMTAVQRIQAFRNGTLSSPMIGSANTATDDANGDNAGAAPKTDTDVVDEECEEQDLTGGEYSEVNSVDADDNDDADPRNSNVAKKNFLAGFPGGKAAPKIPRKAVIIAVPVAALIAAGVLLPGLSKDDEQTPAVPVAAQSSAHPTPTAASVPAVSPDIVIKPAKVEGPEYPISVTPPEDAFPGVNGEKGSGWICSGLDGTVLTITLPGPTAVSEIDVMPGLEGTDGDGSPLWGKHRLVSKVAFGFDYGDPKYVDFVDKKQMQPTTFTGVITRTITITILYTEDISGKGPGGGGDASNGPGILGDLGKTGLDPSDLPGPSSAAEGNSRPATFAIGAIQIMGHTPN